MPKKQRASGESGPPPKQPREQQVLSANQVVAYNLARARRAAGMTQAEAAELLKERTGQAWTAATLGAAERSVSSGRVRSFDANDLLAFSVTFKQPVAYFLMPPGSEETDSRVSFAPTTATAVISESEVLSAAVPLRFSAQVIDDVNRLLAKVGQVWSVTSRVDWLRPDEHYEVEERMAASIEKAPADPWEKLAGDDPWERLAIRIGRTVARGLKEEGYDVDAPPIDWGEGQERGQEPPF